MSHIHRTHIISVSMILVFFFTSRPPVIGQVRTNSTVDTISKIIIEGNKTVSDSVVFSHIKSRPGMRYDPQVIRADEQRLLKTGLFETVKATKKQTDKGIVVVFRVTERPLIKAVVFRGNKAISDKTLAGIVGIKTGDPIDLFKIGSAVQAIREKYEAAGYYYANVRLDKDALDNKREVIYTIVEGPKVSIKAIRFEGAKSFSSWRLKGVIHTRARFWPIIPGTLDTETIQQDVENLKKFYRSKGFLDVQVGKRLDFSPDKSRVILTFLITENRRYRIGKVVFQGNRIFSSAELRRNLRLLPGMFYNELSLQRDIAKVRTCYGTIGYIEAEISAQLSYTAQPGIVNIVYTIAEHQQYRVGRIVIRGNKITKENVIRRHVQLAPGQLYNTVAVKETRLRLLETGLFDKVDITPFGKAPDRRNVLIKVTEAKTAQFLIGAGVSSNRGFIGSVSYSERNFDLFSRPTREDWKQGRAFRGGGQYFRIVAQPGVETMRFHIDWREPYLFDKPYSLGFGAYVHTNDWETYDETRYGGRVSFGHRWPNRWYGEISTRIEGIHASNLSDDAPADVLAAAGTSGLIGIKASLARDRTNKGWLKTRGDRTFVSYEQVTGDYTFGKALADYRIYHTVYTDALERKHVISARAACRAIFGEAPVFERFYGGGLGSLRGFDYRGISPRQGTDNDVIGGDFSIFIGAEYSFPLVGRNLRGVVFVDSGTVERNIEIKDYRVSAGCGIRVYLDFFGRIPMDLYFGFPLNKTDEDDTELVSFSIGWMF